MPRSPKRRSPSAVMLLLATLLLGSLGGARAYHDDDSRFARDRGGYVFATTRALNEMDIHPALKVPILPVAVVLDVVFLPFALIADTMTR